MIKVLVIAGITYQVVKFLGGNEKQETTEGKIFEASGTLDNDVSERGQNPG